MFAADPLQESAKQIYFTEERPQELGFCLPVFMRILENHIGKGGWNCHNLRKH